MKTILSSFPAMLLFAACGTTPSGTTMNLSIVDGAGRTVYFDRYENNTPVHVDSVVLDGSGNGVMHAPPMPLDIYRIALGNEDQLIIGFDSTSDLTITGKAGELMTSGSVKGSTHAEAMVAFMQRSAALEKEHTDLRAVMAADPTDTVALARMNALSKEYIDMVKATIEENPGSPVQYLAVTRLNMRDEMALYEKVRNDLQEPMKRSAIYTAFKENVDRSAKQLEAMKAEEERMAKMSNMLPIGGPAPDFTQNSPEGRPISLSDLRGQVVLIDFWASWCKPCRMENPNVKRVYDKYHRKGFEILGVSLDRAQEAWVGAIQQDGLPWKHVSDLGFWNNEVAQQYGVNSIPYTVLVDREGNIIDKNLRGPALEAKLAELFGS